MGGQKFIQLDINKDSVLTTEDFRLILRPRLIEITAAIDRNGVSLGQPMKSPKSNTRIPIGTIFFETSCYDVSANVHSLHIGRFLFNRLLNQLRVFVSRSRHKRSIGLNR